MTSTPTPTPLVIKLTKHLPLAEKALLAALAIGAILTMLEMDTTITTVALLGLAVTFFLFAYRPIDIPVQEGEQFGFSQLLGLMIIPKVLWISCAVSALGIVFYLLQLGNDGFKQMLMIGVSAIAFAGLLLVILLISGVKHMKLVAPVLLRAIPLLLADVYILLK